jgi:alkanesulfonate monooxygenase SsuD/methylene tetrahydromethanopterin reductase-like flavin-dependent oxidoreductase (luciferase family)
VRGFGFYLPNQDPPRAERIRDLYVEILDMVETGDRLGYAGCFASEHHGQQDGYIPAPFVLCGAAAARSRRMEVGTGVMLLPLWHPVRVAEDGALIDIISGGRFALGAGLGLVQREFDMFGIDMSRATSRFEEAIEVIRLAWTEDRFDFHGRHFDLHDVSVTPKPLHVPEIRIGAMSDRAAERAGRLGDAWLTDPLHGLETMKRWAEIYREAADKAGRPARIHLMRDCWISDGDLYGEWGHYLEDDWRYYFQLGFFKSGRFNPEVEPWLLDLRSADELTFDRVREDRVICGGVDKVRAEVQRWIDEIQPEQFNLRFRYPRGPVHKRVIEVMETFAREVAPRIAEPVP